MIIINSLFKNLAPKIIFLTVILILFSGISSALSLKELTAEEISEIKLYENPATGHRWQIELKNPEVIAAVSDSYEPLAGRDGLVGRGGIHSWSFKAEKKGAALVNFELLGAEDEAPVKEKSFLFAVNLQTEEIAVDEILEIELAENPSTGYRWRLVESDAEILQVLEEEYEPLTPNSEAQDPESEESEAESSRQLVGQGGIKSWTFRGLEAGYQLLSFELARSGGQAIKTVEYLVLVRE